LKQKELIKIGAIAREVRISLKEVQLTSDQINLARQARELAQQRLGIANEKLRRGREANIFEVLELQSDLNFCPRTRKYSTS
jgi:outer membrane protein TolC